MQIDNNDSGNNFGTNGAFMELWGYSGKDEQRWRFTYLNNGYYKIESVISGKVLAVKAGNENVDGEALIQENYSGATRQQWNLEKLSTSYVLGQDRLILTVRLTIGVCAQVQTYLEFLPV